MEFWTGSLSSQTTNLINEKVASYQSSNISINTTHICGFHHEADTINNLICGFLSTPNKNTPGYLISIAIDYINNVECKPKEYDKQFRHYTKRVMFLTNRLFKEELCNRNQII